MSNLPRRLATRAHLRPPWFLAAIGLVMGVVAAVLVIAVPDGPLTVTAIGTLALAAATVVRPAVIGWLIRGGLSSPDAEEVWNDVVAATINASATLEPHPNPGRSLPDPSRRLIRART
jgi:hypothetical protein